MDIKLKKSLKKIGHHLISIKLANKKKIQTTSDFFQHANSTTAAAAKAAAQKAAKANAGLINTNFQQPSAKPDLGLYDCYDLKKRGRGGDGNRMPDTYEPLRYHLKHNDTVTIQLDEIGGKYIARNNACSVSSFMRLRYVQKRQHCGIAEPDKLKNNYDGTEDDAIIIPTYVTKRGVQDRNTTKQIDENLSRLSLFKFIKDGTEHESMLDLFMEAEVYDILRRLFRSYAAGNDGDAFSMDVGEWESLCKDAGLLNVNGMTCKYMYTEGGGCGRGEGGLRGVGPLCGGVGPLFLVWM